MGTSERRLTPPPAWLLRVAWVALPLLVGPAVTQALEGWSRTPRSTAEGLLWAAWGVGLIAVLAPRPLGLTVLRVASAAAVATALAATPGGDPIDVAGALAGSALVVSLITLSVVAEWFANGAAYGNERRFTLRHPPVIGLLAGPLSALALAAAIATGPILLADGRFVLGIGAVVVGAPVTLLLGRSLHALSRRWLILVPGGLVLHDPLTLGDPVLLPTEALHSVRMLESAQAPGSIADLRLGARKGSVQISLVNETQLPVVGRRRNLVEMRNCQAVVVAPSRPGSMLAAVSEHRRPSG